jgi:hypothetical protein
VALGGSCDNDSWCASGSCVGWTCIQPASKHNWEPCAFDQECIGGLCYSGACRCTSHLDCHLDPLFSTSGYCNMGPWEPGNAEGQCHAPRQPVGFPCEDDLWCETGLCGGGVCVAPDSKSNWEPCSMNEECKGGGECWGGVCRCTSHADCQTDPAYGANSFCNMGAWLLTNEEGRCGAPKKPSNVGAYCEDAQWCESGLCSYSGEYLHSVCFTYQNLPHGAECDVNEQCGPGLFCTYWFLQGYKCGN